jgi:hypothetical protein
MSELRFDASQFMRHLTEKQFAVQKGAVRGVQDSMDDLSRIASNIAPIDTGILRASAKARVTAKLNASIIGEVTFSAVNREGNGRFNYALWTHEYMENLGAQSASAPGTDGYTVGDKYLERPLLGEAEKYLRWVAEEIAREMD